MARFADIRVNIAALIDDPDRDRILELMADIHNGLADDLNQPLPGAVAQPVRRLQQWTDILAASLATILTATHEPKDADRISAWPLPRYHLNDGRSWTRIIDDRTVEIWVCPKPELDPGGVLTLTRANLADLTIAMNQATPRDQPGKDDQP